VVSLLSFFIGFPKFCKENGKALIGNKTKPFTTTVVEKMILISQTMWCWGFYAVFLRGCLFISFNIFLLLFLKQYQCSERYRTLTAEVGAQATRVF